MFVYCLPSSMILVTKVLQGTTSLLDTSHVVTIQLESILRFNFRNTSYVHTKAMDTSPEYG